MHDYLLAALGCLFTVLWYLLRQKDDNQERKINENAATSKKELLDLESQIQTSVALLFKKHDEDEKALNSFELQIARTHYIKDELDVKFNKLELSFKESFKEVQIKLDKVIDILVEK